MTQDDPISQLVLPSLPGPPWRTLLVDSRPRLSPSDLTILGPLGFLPTRTPGLHEGLDLVEAANHEVEIYFAESLDDENASLAFFSVELHPPRSRFRVLLLDRASTVDRVRAIRRGIDLVESVAALSGIASFFDRVRRRLRARSGDVGRVLVLDDDPLAASWIAQGLRRFSLDVVILEDPGCLFDALGEHRPDLLLLDPDIPAHPGAELCRAIRGSLEFEDLPVVCLASALSPAVRIELFGAGADDVMPRPVLPEDLAARVLPRVGRRLGRRLRGP